MMFKTVVCAFFLCVLICQVNSEPCGEVACLKIYAPICAQGADKIWKHYNNECEFNSCGGASTFELSCATTATDAASCSC